jgi:1-acyl-sn-glycerol-3-phosphate acyltransferase
VSWTPTSACGTGCLPQMSTLPRVSRPVQIARVLALAATVCAGVGVALLVPMLAPAGRARAIRGWFRSVVAASGVRLVVHGTAGPGPALVASNHVSWLDVPAILATQPMRVVAKSEVRHWPVLGLLATKGGTLYIDRNRLRRLPGTVTAIAAALRGGDSILVFPEGSTWCGRTGGVFRPATMQSAIDAGVAVRPVALRYRLADGTPTTVAAFVGVDSMLASVWRIAATRGLVVDVHLGPPVETVSRSRRETAAAVAARIQTPTPRPPAPARRRRVVTVRTTPTRVGSGQSRRLAIGRRER